jgi:predicted ATP-dependent endonuclease of OLD family
MKMQSVHVRNFRSVLDETLACAELTALVGANGSGKSAFSRALDLFYTPSPRIALDASSRTAIPQRWCAPATVFSGLSS